MLFQEFHKIPRLSRDVVITEKIDGTNGQILLYPTHNSYNGEYLKYILHQYEPYNELGDRLVLMAGSRNRWLNLEKNGDNSGFARWAYENRMELLKLGEGRHFGEWWGNGIQRGYDLKEKRFSLFNTSRWNSEFNLRDGDSTICKEIPICYVVPIISKGNFDTGLTSFSLDLLKENGSYAKPGFMKPEGIVIYHVAGNLYFKKTIEKDESPKGVVK